MRHTTRATPEIRIGFATLAVTASFLVSVAHAQALEELALEQQGLGGALAPGTWRVTLGAGLADRPDFPGSSHYEARPVPLIAIGYGDRVTVGPFGLGIAVLDWQGLRLGPVLGIESGRRESVDSHLDGLGDIPTSVTAGAFVSYRLGVFDFYATARQALNDSGSGLAGLVQFNFRRALVPRKLYLIAGPNLEFGNREHEQTWFGVNATQSLQSGLPEYSPTGGLNTVGVHASLTYLASDHLLWRVFSDLKDLSGQAANSPIVERRTEHVIGLGLAYHF